MTVVTGQMREPGVCLVGICPAAVTAGLRVRAGPYPRTPRPQERAEGPAEPSASSAPLSFRGAAGCPRRRGSRRRQRWLRLRGRPFPFHKRASRISPASVPAVVDAGNRPTSVRASWKVRPGWLVPLRAAAAMTPHPSRRSACLRGRSGRPRPPCLADPSCPKAAGCQQAKDRKSNAGNGHSELPCQAAHLG